MCPVALDPTSLRRGLRAPVCVATHCGPWASSTKKSLAGFPVRQGSPVSNARAHVSKAPNVMAIMGLQDVRAGTTANAYRTCGHTAIVQRQCY
jgi:hypothetical protein